MYQDKYPYMAFSSAVLVMPYYYTYRVVSLSLSMADLTLTSSLTLYPVMKAAPILPWIECRAAVCQCLLSSITVKSKMENGSFSLSKVVLGNVIHLNPYIHWNRIRIRTHYFCHMTSSLSDALKSVAYCSHT